MERKQRSIRVLMMPYLAYGHISPYLELARALAKRNFFVYLCSTPINLTSIKKRVEKYSLPIELVEIHLPSLPELPPHYHSTNGLPCHLMPTLETTFKRTMKTNFANILNTLRPDLVIYDFNQPWAPAIAKSHNIPAIEFMTVGAAMGSYGFHTWTNPNVQYPFQAIRLQTFYESQFHRMLNLDPDHMNDIMEAIKGSCNFVLFNTFREIEEKYMVYLSIMAQKKVVPVGPLVQELVLEESEGREIIQWLDKKDESSTVLVSFGSEYYLSKIDLEEVAYGLELSEVNFIWVLKFPKGDKVVVEEALPEGFLERAGGRGLVVEGWAPQAQILAHSSTGGFVSHCGWNSVLESLVNGVPIVAMPMHLDQPLNAKLVEEVGVAMQVSRDENGRLDREVIAEKIRNVVVEKNGECTRAKAREFSCLIRRKGEEELDEVVEKLVKLCKDYQEANAKE